jgi:hypothetical protein
MRTIETKCIYQKVSDTGFVNGSSLAGQAFKDFSMTLLELHVPFYADGFAKNFVCAFTKFLWSLRTSFLRSLPETSQVEPALLLERAFVCVARTP